MSFARARLILAVLLAASCGSESGSTMMMTVSDAGAIDDAGAGDAESLPDGAIVDPTRDNDGDGLTDLEEQAFAQLTSSPPGCVPSPTKKSILLELDSMSGRALDDATLAVVAGAFAALPGGVELCIYRDEENIAPADFDGDLMALGAFLAAHGPRFAPRGLAYRKMIHAVIVTRRTDLNNRGGDTILDTEGGVENSGILIYRDALESLHPACETPMLPGITSQEAIAGSLVHELGHALQLGHDTDVNGGVVHWNIMSVQTSCLEAQRRTHGAMNRDPALGNTEDVSAPRFSHAAAALMSFTRKVSADVSEFDRENGFEM